MMGIHSSEAGTKNLHYLMPFEKFKTSCKGIMENQYGNEPFAKLISVKSLYMKFELLHKNRSSMR